MPLPQKSRRTLRLLVIVVALSALVGAAFGPIISLIRGSDARLLDAWSGIAHGVAISTLIMALEVFLAESRFGRRVRLLPLLPYVAIKSFAYLACILAGMFIARHVPGNSSTPYGADLPTLIVIAFGFSASFVATTLLEINRLLGHGVLLSQITGRYHRPRVETRIFLLADLRDSTRIAEQLGDLAFHRFLNRLYFELTGPVLEHRGEIHKYVGDEMIVTWPHARGVRGAACVAAAFAMLDRLSERAEEFRAEFGTAPGIRVALHAGPVVSGEMGDVRREIAFLGDTVNTAARIETFAKTRGEDVVISASLLRELTLPAAYEARSLGHAELQGKEQALELFALRRNSIG